MVSQMIFIGMDCYGKIINNKYTKKDDWPFNDYFYFIINLAVGGDFAGEIIDEDLPFVFVIDYIKVYQKLSFTQKFLHTQKISY